MENHSIIPLNAPENDQILEMHKFLFPDLQIEAYYTTDSVVSDNDYYMIYDKKANYETMDWFNLCMGAIFPKIIELLPFEDKSSHQLTLLNIMLEDRVAIIPFLYGQYLLIKHV